MTAGSPSQRLAQQGSGGYRLSTAVTLWRSEIARVTERRNGSLGRRDDDDDDEGCTTLRLPCQPPYKIIIDVFPRNKAIYTTEVMDKKLS